MREFGGSSRGLVLARRLLFTNRRGHRHGCHFDVLSGLHADVAPSGFGANVSHPQVGHANKSQGTQREIPMCVKQWERYSLGPAGPLSVPQAQVDLVFGEPSSQSAFDFCQYGRQLCVPREAFKTGTYNLRSPVPLAKLHPDSGCQEKTVRRR